MSIAAQEEKLFKAWKGAREDFVRDGVVSERDYLASQPKIIFVLKEVNDPGGGGWDLREFVFRGGRAQTWNNIAIWVHGIRNRRNIPNWDFYSSNMSNDFRVSVLRSIGALNLKKSPGTHTTDMASVEAIAKEDKDYIRRQYAIYDPDLTICGGTGDLFKLVAGHQERQWQKTKRGIWWYERSENKRVISFPHPEARVHAPLLAYGLVDAVNEIFE